VHALDADQWERLRRFGPVKSILAHGISAASALEPLQEPWPETAGREFRDVRERSVSAAAGVR
jgi:hypothetical protein